jgi:hypothetical protein
MPCGICREVGHTAARCESPVIVDTAEQISQESQNNINKYMSEFSELDIREVLPAYMISRSTPVNLRSHRFPPDHVGDASRVTMIDARIAGIEYLKEICRRNMTRLMRPLSISVPLLRRVLPVLTTTLGGVYPDEVREYVYSLNPNEEIHTKTALTRRITDMMVYIFKQKITPLYLDYTNVPDDAFISSNPQRRENPLQRLKRLMTENMTNLLETRDIEAYAEAEKQVVTKYIKRIMIRQQRFYERQILDIHRENMTAPIPAVKDKIRFRMDTTDAKYISDEICSICMDELMAQNTVAMSCGHSYCVCCTGEFITRCNGKCPTCRDDIKEVRFKKEIEPDRFNALVSKLTN